MTRDKTAQAILGGSYHRYRFCRDLGNRHRGSHGVPADCARKGVGVCRLKGAVVCRLKGAGVCRLKGAVVCRLKGADVCRLEGAVVSHSEHRFPAPSSKLPDLVTPLKGHSLFPRSCPSTRSAPSERFGY